MPRPSAFQTLPQLPELALGLWWREVRGMRNDDAYLLEAVRFLEDIPKPRTWPDGDVEGRLSEG